MPVQPLLKLNNFQRVSRGDQRLTEQVVGIKRYRRYERIELIRWNLNNLRCAQRRRCMSRKNRICGQQRRRAHHCHQISNYLWFGFEYSTYDTHSNPPDGLITSMLMRVDFLDRNASGTQG